MKKSLSFILICFAVLCFSQDRKIFSGKEIDYSVGSHQKQNPLCETLYNYTIFSINSEELSDFVKNKDISLITLKLGSKHSFDIDLEPRTIFTSDYENNMNGISTKSIHDKPQNMTYKGISGKNKIAMTIGKNVINAYIKTKNGSYYIEPLHDFDKSADKNLYVFYSDKDVKPTDYKCGLSETKKQSEALKNYSLTANSETTETVKGCTKVRLALATTYDVYKHHGENEETVRTRLATIINNVNTDYDDAFQKVISFEIASTYIATTEDSALDVALGNTTESGTLLNRFRNWGNASNLSESFYDLGILFARRNFQQGRAGLTWVNVLCSSPNNRYIVISENHTDRAAVMRATVSHEIGHTFDCEHSSWGIMQPFTSAAVQWAPVSINSINNKEASISCNSGNHRLQGSSTAIFTLATTACKNETIVLDAFNSRNTTSYNWQALGSANENSTEKRTTTSYSTSGKKEIKLTVSNAYTCNENTALNSITKNIEIMELAEPTKPSCNYATSNSGTGGYYGVSPVNVKFGTINRNSQDAADDKKVYDNNTCSIYTTVTEGSTVPLSVSKETHYDVATKVWIDYNNDGNFTNNELVMNIPANKIYTNTKNVVIPENAQFTDTLLRMRVITDMNRNIDHACGTNYGQVEDYGVIIKKETLSTAEQKTASEIVLANNPIGNSAEFILPKNISDKKIKIHAYDMSGKWIATQTLQNNNGRAIIPTSAWEKGAYLFVIEFDGKMQKSIKALK